ncbi:hypothetical protein FB567DRAFT_594973 [Paraphoma chrysanthemicola]|uniref:Uncharacterized protein n=1 Tax=Paraphoma chrysanthemicola TaxID=798071 RepID=A0A8K0R179_9PLEO|nr:hypothetical protein FB567DRAFT_594973 [Paraphoma chrysanthemicola]
MANQMSDKLFWLAYCDLIKKQVGVDLGAKSAIFYCTRTQRGPPAGDSIAAEYTNTGLFDLGDNLLQADNLFYVPSAQNSYIRSLLTYLNFVDLGGIKGDDQLGALKSTAEALDATQVKMNTELDKALATYLKMKSAGVTEIANFGDWYPQEAQAFKNAKDAFDAAASDNQKAILAAGQNKIDDALSSQKVKPNLTMACTNLTPANAAEILNAYNKGEKIPAPAGIYWRPDYHCPNYASTVKSWQNLVGSTVKRQEFTLNLDSGKSVKETSFGQTTGSAGVSFDYGPWISFGAGGSANKTEDSLKTDDESQNISITVSFDDMRAVTISPGEWNIGDPKSRYPKLKEGAPPGVKTLVLPSQLILVSKLGYKVKFGAKLASTFDSKVTETKSADGYVRILGIPIKIGGDVKRSTESTTHVGTWDNSAGEFTVEPTNDGGFASVVAIVGEKVQTT